MSCLDFKNQVFDWLVLPSVEIEMPSCSRDIGTPSSPSIEFSARNFSNIGFFELKFSKFSEIFVNF